MPEVQVLFLIDPYHQIQLAGRFTKLSELNTYGTSGEDLMRILGHVGRRLDTLRVTLNYVVQLDKVLDACPNLSVLDLHTGGLDSANQLRPDTVRRLRSLFVSFMSTTRGTVRPGLLVQLLRLVPNLRKLLLTFSRLDDDHVQELTELVRLSQQRVVLRCLQELTIQMGANNGTTDSQRRILGLVVYKLAMHCPRLNFMGRQY